ncbi:MAG: twin-arginine translocation signal domain-containing protein [Candidatus Hydrogenedentota bacterium]
MSRRDFMKTAGAIYAAGGADLTGTRIHHNWLHDAKNDPNHEFPVGAGIYFDQNAKPSQIDHNVFWNNYKNDIRLEQATEPFHQVFNNTLASTSDDYWYSFDSYPASKPSNTVNNIYRSAIRPDAPGPHEMGSQCDPKFVKTGEGGLEFRLLADSPAIDRGVVIEGVTADYAGKAPDLGAYEHDGTDWIAGCSLP